MHNQKKRVMKKEMHSCHVSRLQMPCLDQQYRVNVTLFTRKLNINETPAVRRHGLKSAAVGFLMVGGV